MTTGYAHFANFLTAFPDLASFRKFNNLSFKTLLYLQAELTHLEDELHLREKVDEQHVRTESFAGSWEKMWNASEDHNDNEQKKTVELMVDKLDKYHRTLLQVTKVQDLQRPERHLVVNLQSWLQSRQGGKGFLRGLEAEPWEDHYQDLAAIHVEGDSFDNFLAAHVSPWYYGLVGKHRKPNVDPEKNLGNLYEHKQKGFMLLGNILCVLMSSIVLSGAILSLFFVQSTRTRLLMITAYNIIFASILMFVVGCRRIDVFAATAAFAAVLVVFIQGIGPP